MPSSASERGVSLRMRLASKLPETPFALKNC
jgi:hypothetical protein